MENTLDLKRKLSSRVIYRLSTVRVHVIGAEFIPNMQQMQPLEADIINIFQGEAPVQRPSASAACYSSQRTTQKHFDWAAKDILAQQ